MSESRWRVVIVDMPHREDLFAEIWIDKELWSEVYVQDGKATMETYPHPTDGKWTFEYNELAKMLAKVDAFLESINVKRQ